MGAVRPSGGAYFAGVFLLAGFYCALANDLSTYATVDAIPVQELSTLSGCLRGCATDPENVVFPFNGKPLYSLSLRALVFTSDQAFAS